jgi:hypothetical protein
MDQVIDRVGMRETGLDESGQEAGVTLQRDGNACGILSFRHMPESAGIGTLGALFSWCRLIAGIRDVVGKRGRRDV